MNDILVVFSSFATANRVKNLLKKKHDISSEIMQTPVEIKLKSCGYCLKMPSDCIELVWNIIKKNALSSKGIFSANTYQKLR